MAIDEDNAYLHTLRQRMTDRQLGHIIPLFPQADKIIVYPRLILPRIIEIERLRLYIIRRQLLRLKLGNVLQEPLLLFQRHTPYHHGAVVEQKNLRRMHLRVEV